VAEGVGVRITAGLADTVVVLLDTVRSLLRPTTLGEAAGWPAAGASLSGVFVTTAAAALAAVDEGGCACALSKEDLLSREGVEAVAEAVADVLMLLLLSSTPLPPAARPLPPAARPLAGPRSSALWPSSRLVPAPPPPPSSTEEPDVDAGLATAFSLSAEAAAGVSAPTAPAA
jgi:hypothetical protein